MLLYISMEEKERTDKTDERKSAKSANVRKLVILAFFTSLSLVTFMIEALLPPLFIPGAKLGLANIFSLLALILFGPIEALAVFLVRALLGSFITGAVSSLVYSLVAGVVSLALSSLLVYLVMPRVSVVAISVACACLHNVTQNLLFVLLNGATAMLTYMPYLALIGAVSGLFVGVVVHLLVIHLPERVLLGSIPRRNS